MSETFKVVVRSIGGAGAGMVGVLRRVMPHSPEYIAQRLFQAPAVLVEGLDRETAESVKGVLDDTGLVTEVVTANTEVEPGDSRHEMALTVRDFDKVGELMRTLAVVLGCDAETARKLLLQSPAVVLGKVSAATVEALEPRFAAAGAEVDVSDAETAVFDVFMGACEREELLRAQRFIKDGGIEPLEQPEGAGGGGALLAAGLDKAQADRLWNRMGRSALPVRVLPRDFQRFDVFLNEADPSAETLSLLTELTGMPERIARKVVERLPVVILQAAPFPRMEEALAKLAAAGAEASAELITFRTFRLVLEEAGNKEHTVKVLRALGDVDDKTALESVRKTPAVLDGPFSTPAALWLAHELKKTGASVRLEAR